MISWSTLLCTLLSALKSCTIIFWAVFFLAILPMASALPNESAFPNITFAIFSEFIQKNFSSDISLATVFTVLLTLTHNPLLLTLHARQQNPAVQGENKSKTSGWIKALARALKGKLDAQSHTLQTDSEEETTVSDTSLGEKLDKLSKLLKLYPYNTKGKFQNKLMPVSHTEIQPAIVICPDSFECEDMACKPWALHQVTKYRDVPRVTLIKGSEIYKNTSVLTGECKRCRTFYSADHEHLTQNITETETRCQKLYLNSATYLKIGQNLWVDRVFSNAVVNGMYSFHGSAAAYMEYWNNCFGAPQQQQDKPFKISRRQVWQAFVQETTRTIAAASDINLELNDGLAIDEVTKEAFNILGENGLIRASDKHSCSECTQKYKATSDIDNGADPAAVVGVDENRTVPPFEDPNSETNAQNIAQAENTPVDHNIDDEPAPVKMIVMDGIVMGPQHCALMDVLLVSQILVVEYSATFIMQNMEPNAESMVVHLQKLMEHKLVISIEKNGQNINLNISQQLYLV